MMIDPFTAALRVAGSALEAQSTRLRVISENIANAESTSATAGGDPYARKTITFTADLDRLSGTSPVRVEAIGTDSSAFRLGHDPSNPAADASGMVKYPNVNVLLEMADMREANRSYEANIQIVRQSRDLLSMTIDLLKAGG
jgi:flagellar basal-body rod protein FlgC